METQQLPLAALRAQLQVQLVLLVNGGMERLILAGQALGRPRVPPPLLVRRVNGGIPQHRPANQVQPLVVPARVPLPTIWAAIVC